MYNNNSSANNNIVITMMIIIIIILSSSILSMAGNEPTNDWQEERALGPFLHSCLVNCRMVNIFILKDLNSCNISPSFIYNTSFQKRTYHEPTIYNLSTAHGKAGVAVIRISGNLSVEVK
jgi:hypothetical protein